MTEATWSRHPRALDLCHLRKQNKRDNEKTEISPKKAKSNLDSNYTNPWCGLDRKHAQDHITNERISMDSCFSLLLGLISVAQPFYNHALIIVIIIIIAIIITINLVPRSHSVTGNVRSGKVRQYTIFRWPLKKRLRQCNLRSDWLISRGT